MSYKLADDRVQSKTLGETWSGFQGVTMIDVICYGRRDRLSRSRTVCLFAVSIALTFGALFVIARPPAAFASYPENEECNQQNLLEVVETDGGLERWECLKDIFTPIGAEFDIYYWNPLSTSETPDNNEPQEEESSNSSLADVFTDSVFAVPVESTSESVWYGASSINQIWAYSPSSGAPVTVPRGMLSGQNIIDFSPNGSMWSTLATGEVDYNFTPTSTLHMDNMWSPVAGWTDDWGYIATYSYGAVYEGASAGWVGGWQYSGATGYPSCFGVTCTVGGHPIGGTAIGAAEMGAVRRNNSASLVRVERRINAPSVPKVTTRPPVPKTPTLRTPPRTARNLAAERRLRALMRETQGTPPTPGAMG